MKISFNVIYEALLTAFCFFPLTRLFAQKVEFFPKIAFDSTYSVVGTFDYPNDPNDTTIREGFLIDKLDDLVKLKKEWVFSERVPTVSLEGNSITVYTIQEKRTAQKVGLIYPSQGIINSDGRWYYFDVKKYTAFFNNHLIKYHAQNKVFENYQQYVAYGNALLTDSSVLFFFEPDRRFEGKFTITVDRKSSPSDPYYKLWDIKRELSYKFSNEFFQCSIVKSDSFNLTSKDKVKITVESSRNLYDKYNSKKNVKSDWTPTPIDIRIYRRD